MGWREKTWSARENGGLSGEGQGRLSQEVRNGICDVAPKSKFSVEKKFRQGLKARTRDLSLKDRYGHDQGLLVCP